MEKEACEKAILETTKKASQAALKWFNETFDDDLLEEMEEKGLIAQAEGFSTSAAAELMATIEMEILGKLVEEEVDAQHDDKEEDEDLCEMYEVDFEAYLKTADDFCRQRSSNKVSAYTLPDGEVRIKAEGSQFSGEIKDISIVQTEVRFFNSDNKYTCQYAYEVKCNYKPKYSADWRHFKGDIVSASLIKSTEAPAKALRFILANIQNGDIKNEKV